MRDLADGQAVDSVFEVREVTRRQKKNGEPFLKLQLGDVTGAIEGVAWDSVDEIAEVAAARRRRPRVRPLLPGLALRRVDHRARVRAAEPSEYEPADLLECAPIPFDQMCADLGELIATVQQPHLRELLERLLGEGTETGARWREAPGREGLPPGLPPRADRALALGRPGRERHGVHLPRHRP